MNGRNKNVIANGGLKPITLLIIDNGIQILLQILLEYCF